MSPGDRPATDVLVVDPGELGDLLAAMFDQYQIRATRARSGEEALERALADKPPVIIVDHVLPDAPGIDVAELLRNELKVKVIFTYPQALAGDPDSAALMGRIGALEAPFARPFRSLSLVESTLRLLGRESLDHGDVTGPVRLSSTEGLPNVDDEEELTLEVEAPTTEEDAREQLSSGGAAAPLAERIAEQKKAVFNPGSLSELWDKVKQRRSTPTASRAPSAGNEVPLNPRAFADMLDAFHQSQTTGELWLQNARMRRVLLLRRGVIVGARSNIDAEEISSLAAKKGILSGEAVAEIRNDVLTGSRRTVVDSILARGLLSEDDLKRLVVDHVQRVALGTFLWQSGSMRVTLEGRAAREPVPVMVRAGEMIVRGILLSENDDALKAAAPDDARFSPAADSGYGLEDLALSAEEARIVVAMDGTKTVKDLLVLFPNVQERVIRGIAAGLLCLNLIRFSGWGHAEARRISFF